MPDFRAKSMPAALATKYVLETGSSHFLRIIQNNLRKSHCSVFLDSTLWKPSLLSVQRFLQAPEALQMH